MTSYSYSYEYSYEYDHASDDDSDVLLHTPAKPEKKKASSKSKTSTQAKGKGNAQANKRKQTLSDSPSPARYKAEKEERPPTRDVRTNKDEAISQLLSRWWYVLPPWPPLDWDYEEQLKLNKMKVVSLKEWPDADDVDESGFKKCYALANMEGFYRMANGDLMDLRPVDGKPCYEGLKKQSYKDICSMLIIALENQIEDLSLSLYKNTDHKYIEDQERRLRTLLADYKKKVR